MSIRISQTAARWIIAAATRLVQDGFGVYLWHPLEPIGEADFPGLIDNIPMEDHATYHWANALLSFARVMANIAQNAVNEDEATLNELIEDAVREL